MAVYRNPASFKVTDDFLAYLNENNIDIGLKNGTEALAQSTACYSKTIGNRWAILPMEGWDCLADGAPSEYTRRRWLRFAASGAKLLFGTEAAAVMHSARSNPNQLWIHEKTVSALTQLQQEMRQTHAEKFGSADDFMMGLQLTHSGRFAHPNVAGKREAKTAYAHPLLDKKCGCGPQNVLTDLEISDIIEHFVTAAKLSQQAGFDFVDIKHAHGYLGHEFLTAFDRPGPYGGSFENRTRFCREIIAGIRRDVPGMAVAVRLSLFDILPFRRNDDGSGSPMEWQGAYPYAFGGDGSGLEMAVDLGETAQFLQLLQDSGVELICTSVGSPYYNVHLQRPAYFPVCDGYKPPVDPLFSAARHIKAVKLAKELFPNLKFVASGLTVLQEFLPEAAEYIVANGIADFAGIGRMALSYPDICADNLAGKVIDRKRICRTLGECTNSPRNGRISGCFPLDPFYKKMPMEQRILS